MNKDHVIDNRHCYMTHVSIGFSHTMWNNLNIIITRGCPMKKKAWPVIISFCIMLCFFFLYPLPAQGVEIYSLMATRTLPSLGIYNIEYFKTHINKDPNLTKGYDYLVDFQFQKAIDELTLCVKNNKNKPLILSEAYAFIGYCHLNLRNADDAIAALEKSIALDPRNEIPHFFLANEYFLDGKMDKVKTCLIEAIELHPKFIAALRMLAETYKDERNGALAITYYKKIVDILPNSGYYRFQLYRVYFDQRMYKEAEEQLKKLIVLEPGYSLNYSRLGETYVRQKKYEKALAIYDKFLQDKKSAAIGHLGRAKVFLAQGKLAPAKKEIRAALKLAPDDREVKEIAYEIATIEHETRNRFVYSFLSIGLILLLFGTVIYYVYSTHRRNYVLSIISKFNESLDQIYEMGELAVFLLEYYSKLFAIESGLLLLHNRQNNTLSILISRGLEDREHEHFQIVTGNDVSNWIMHESKPLMTIKELERSRLFEESFPSLIERLKKKKMAYLIPLKEKNSCIGFIIMAQNKGQDPKAFSQFDLLVPLTAVSAQAMQTLFLFESSIVDELTGLYNKRYFYQSIALELKRADRYQQPCALCTCDLDDFKKINDTYGHTQGDQVLKEFGAILKNSIRDGIDVATRTGGEEFHLILPATTLELSCIVAERVRVAVEEHTFQGFDRPVQVTVSIGISAYPSNAADEAELIKTSDKALYLAKTSGKNRFKKADELGLSQGRKTFRSEPILENRFDHLNIKDEATGLSNFSYFSMRIKEEIKRAERYKFPCSLLVIKLKLNPSDDRVDSILEAVSVIVKSNLREGIDTPARIGEDMVGIIIPETPREKAIYLAERIKQSLEKKELKIDDERVEVTLGLSSFPECAQSANDIMESATKASKRRQQPGEIRVVVAPVSQSDTAHPSQ
jgi:diguanylate cyclase (GGDEF)-like protein